jgi:hypothetical protein
MVNGRTMVADGRALKRFVKFLQGPKPSDGAGNAC